MSCCKQILFFVRFVVRLVDIDHLTAPVIEGIDAELSEFSGNPIERVPLMRVSLRSAKKSEFYLLKVFPIPTLKTVSTVPSFFCWNVSEIFSKTKIAIFFALWELGLFIYSSYFSIFINQNG